MNRQDEIGDLLKKHFENPKLNAFAEDELSIDVLKQNTRLYLNLPNGLKKHAIYNMMKKFGHVISVHIPFELNDKNKNDRLIAFVEYEKFKEAEKALRELNSQNHGLNIRAEFSHTTATAKRVQKSPEKETQEDPEDEIEDINLPITINFHQLQSDDVYEKVTNFEFQMPISTDTKTEEYIKNLAMKSDITYDDKQKTFDYNSDLIDYNFLTFYCYNCEEEATLRCDKLEKYFCSTECYDDYTKQLKNDTDEYIPEYHVNKSDKVRITAIINEKCVYICPYQEDLNFLLEDVYRKAKNANPIEEIPKIGDDVLVKLSNENIYRAKVLEISNEEKFYAIVLLTDIGNTIQVDILDILDMPFGCLKLKKITTKVYLKDVNIDAINYDVIGYMKGLLFDQTELTVKYVDKDIVLLKDNNRCIMVNEKINELGNFENVKFDTTDQLPLENGISCGSKQKLFVVNTDYLEEFGEIICVSEKYLKDFLEFYKSLNAYGSKINRKEYGIPGVKKLCLAKFNNQWHRALIHKAVGDGKPTSVLLDLNFVCNISVEDIFPIPTVLANVPLYSEQYKIYGYNENEKLKSYCNRVIVENDFLIVDEIKYEDGGYVIYINVP